MSDQVRVLGRMCVLALSMCVGVGVAGAGQKAAPRTHAAAQAYTVMIHNFAFQPAELTVKAGDSIEWKNTDLVAHTVTAEDGSFDSGKIASGGTWKMVAKKAGRHAYRCSPHPNMHGSLIVK